MLVWCFTCNAPSSAMDHAVTYVANVDDFTSISAGCCVVGERVRSWGRGVGVKSRTARTAAAAAMESSTATTISESTTSSKSSTAAEAAAKSSAHATISTTSEARAARASESVFADLNGSSLPIIAVELLNGVTSVVGALKNYNTRALGSTVRSHVNISTDDTTSAG